MQGNLNRNLPVQPGQRPVQRLPVLLPDILTGFPKAFKGSCFNFHFLILHKVKPPKETVLPRPDPCPRVSDKWDRESALAHGRAA